MPFPTFPSALHPRWIFACLLCAATANGCGSDDASSDGSGASGSGAAGSGAQGSGASGASGAGGSPSSGSTGASGGAASSGAGGAPTTFAAMCAAPGVVFCDAFEGGWADDWTEDGGDVQIVPGAAVDGEGATVVELSTYGDIQSSKLLRTFADADRIHVRFDVQYDEAYDNSGGSHGPILGGSDSPPWGMLGTAGNKPNGSDFFVLNFEPKGVVGDGGELGFYAYFVNMEISGDGNYWGNDFVSAEVQKPVIVPGAWHCSELSLTLNAPDASDGRADFWFDGVHHGAFDGFQWRTDPSLRVTTFALDSYNHMNDGPIPESTPNRVRYDNLVISTEPVGCLQ
jgi:hypothetical protein